MMVFALIVAVASSIYLADMPNPKYEAAVRRFEKRCGHMDSQRVDELKKLVAQLHSEGKKRTRAQEARRTYCKEWSSDLKACSIAIVSLQYTPATIPRPPVKKPLQFSPKILKCLARGDLWLEGRINHWKREIIEARKSLKRAAERLRQTPPGRSAAKKRRNQEVRRWQTVINNAEQKMLDLQSKFGSYPASLYKIGGRDSSKYTVGVLRGWKLSVMEIIDSTNMIVSFSDSGRWWIAGYPTDGLTLYETYSFEDELFENVGIKEYHSSLGTLTKMGHIKLVQLSPEERFVLGLDSK